MKKFILFICSLLFITMIVVMGYSLYIGNYLYDYLLNPSSTNQITETKTDEKSYQWMNDNSEDVYIKSNDNLKLHAYFLKEKSHNYMIMVHGYKSDGSKIVAPIKKMKKNHFNVLAPTLRGHGKSEGDYIGMGWDERLDIVQWIDYILEYDHQASIVLYGISMGGATVMNTAGEKLPQNVKCVIEDCGYSSAFDVFKSYISSVDISLNEFEEKIALRVASLVTYIRAGYRLEDAMPIKQIQKCTIPILFIHGEKDELVSCDMAYELYNQANCEKQLLVVKDAKHGKSYSQDSKLYYSTVMKFIKKYL